MQSTLQLVAAEEAAPVSLAPTKLPLTNLVKPTFFDDNVAAGWPPSPKLFPLPEAKVTLEGPRIKADLLFSDQAARIYNETGYDPYDGQTAEHLTGLPQFDWKIRHRSRIVRVKKPGVAKDDGSWETIEIPSVSGRSVCKLQRRTVDGEVVELRAFIDRPYLHRVKREEELTPEELFQKRQQQAAIARTSKAVYREDDRTDNPRFGFCKRKQCENHKVRRLVVRSLCRCCRQKLDDEPLPGCRQQTDGAVSSSPTVAERRQLVLDALQAHPEATQRELAKLTGVSQPMVSRILRVQSVQNEATEVRPEG